VIGQLRQHFIEVTGLFACGDQGAIEFREIARMTRVGCSQTLAAAHISPDRCVQIAHGRFFGLRLERLQGLRDRQPGAHQACQLPRHDGALLAAQHAPPQHKAGAASFCQFATNGVDREWRETALAQLRTRQPGAICIDYTFFGLAAAKRRLITIGRHL
jgi:hypothetical protein